VDDSLDAFSVHGVGGAWGALATGLFCSVPVAGLVYGNAGQFVKQLIGVGASAAFVAGMTWVLASLLDATMGLRVPEPQERDGLDLAAHGERGYHL
jgi:Amt family ammonium transporter